ncbi:MAG: alpha/beta fold hydrolase [Pseudomonadota bacterium]
MTLNAHRRGTDAGSARQMVVFVHGYGADGNDLISLADPLAEHMPGTVFYAPDAPNRCQMNPMGFEWFPIPWLDNSTEEAAMAGLASSATMLDTWLTDTLAAEGLTPDRLALVGFSQGTMMSLHVAPRRDTPIAAITGFSGRLLTPERLGDVTSKPPVLLVHGDMDDMVPPKHMPEAAEALSKAGFEVYTHVSKGTGHGIAPDGLSLCLSFMLDKLGIAVPEGS